MPRNYLRNQDDAYSDPEIIAAKYQVGKNAFFEVSLALSELETYQSRSAGSSVNPQEIVLQFQTLPHIHGCPWEYDYIWVKQDNIALPVESRDLLDLSENWEIYNPLSTKFNTLESAILLQNVDLFNVYLKSRPDFAYSRVTETHSIIRNTMDVLGTRMKEGLEITRMDANRNIYQDTIDRISFFKKGNAVKIKLKEEFIYATGHIMNEATLAHNYKLPPRDEEL